MKRLILDLTLACAMVLLINGNVYGQNPVSARTPGETVLGCDERTGNIPVWGTDFVDSAYFISDDTFYIPANNGATVAIWSDIVETTDCQKTTFNGGTEEDGFNSDCRSIPGFEGTLFSWCAVARYKIDLCPFPWRVPTREDYVNLDEAIGGSTANGQYISPFYDPIRNYSDTLDCKFTGYCDGCGEPAYQNSHALYWTQTERSKNHAYSLNLHVKGNVHPQNYNCKVYGFALRCVRP